MNFGRAMSKVLIHVLPDVSCVAVILIQNFISPEEWENL